MSRIIKADYIIKGPNIGGVKTGDQCSCGSDEDFSKETANAIYLETKVMIEELIAQAEVKAQDILAVAKIEAQAILDQAQEEARIIKEEARQQGSQEGQKKGLLETEELYEQAQALLASIPLEKEQLLTKHTPELCELILLICEKILGNVVEFKPELMGPLVQSILRQGMIDRKSVV